jgi:hypothetical protein
MNAGRFTGFLEKLLHDFDRPVFLVVDGSSVHKAKKVREFAAGTQGRLELFFRSYSASVSGLLVILRVVWSGWLEPRG